jgi:hypothetical protein
MERISVESEKVKRKEEIIVVSTINIGDEKNSGIGIRRTDDIGIESTELVNVTSSCTWIQRRWI